VRLACVKHAASVRSEPGSNSQVHPKFAPPPKKQQPKPETNIPTQHALNPTPPHKQQRKERPENIINASQSNQIKTHQQTPQNHQARVQPGQSQTPIQTHTKTTPALTESQTKTPPTYPFQSHNADFNEQPVSGVGDRSAEALVVGGGFLATAPLRVNAVTKMAAKADTRPKSLIPQWFPQSPTAKAKISRKSEARERYAQAAHLPHLPSDCRRFRRLWPPAPPQSATRQVPPSPARARRHGWRPPGSAPPRCSAGCAG